MYWCEKSCLNIVTKLHWCKRPFNNQCEGCIFKEDFKDATQSIYEKVLKIVVNLEALSTNDPIGRDKLVKQLTEVMQVIKTKGVADGKVK